VQLPDLTNPFWFLVSTLMMFVVVTGRYFLVAGFFHAIFYVWFSKRWQFRRINHRPYRKDQFKKEVFWSCITAMLFAVSGSFTALLWQKGFIKIYIKASDYPLWWLPTSLLLALFLHETYYYWIHRWMHRPAVFKMVHKVHHDSNITSAWTAFSFHPLEGLLQALFLPLVLLILPIQLYILIIQLTIMTLSSVINHLDIEIYPRNFHKHFPGKYLIGATHHALHHKQFKYNYGLYFTFWDKWKATESPDFSKLFEDKTKGKQNNKEAMDQIII
jgi:lathosterol oxidase